MMARPRRAVRWSKMSPEARRWAVIRTSAAVENPPGSEFDEFENPPGSGLFRVLLIPDPPGPDGWSGGRYSIVPADPENSGLAMREDPNLPGHYLIEGGLL